MYQKYLWNTLWFIWSWRIQTGASPSFRCLLTKRGERAWNSVRNLSPLRTILSPLRITQKKKNAASCNLFSGYIPRAIYSSIWSFLPDSVIWPNKIQLPNKCVSLGIMLLGEGPASLWSQIMWPVLRSHQRGQPQAFRIHRVFRLKHVFLFRGKNFLGKNLYHLPIEF